MVREICDQNGNRVSKNNKIYQFALYDQKLLLINYKKYGAWSKNVCYGLLYQS